MTSLEQKSLLGFKEEDWRIKQRLKDLILGMAISII